MRVLTHTLQFIRYGSTETKTILIKGISRTFSYLSFFFLQNLVLGELLACTYKRSVASMKTATSFLNFFRDGS